MSVIHSSTDFLFISISKAVATFLKFRLLLKFLKELKANNNRPWFNDNKKRYENHVKAPALRFITDFAEPLAGISGHFRAIPKATGGSLFRIYRDT